jgi:2-aminoadipate transaminase
MQPSQLSALGRRVDFPAIARLMNAAFERPGVLSLAAGFTDNRTLPLAEVAEAARELALAGDASVLQYGANQGNTALRAAVAARLVAMDGGNPCGIDASRVMITNGSQQALHLAASLLCDPGDIVLVETPTYFVFLEVLKGLGIRAVPMPAGPSGEPDLAGLGNLIDALRASGELARVRLVYLVSYHSNPSSRSLSLEEKAGLGRLLKAALPTVAVLEDAAYRELGYDGGGGACSVFAMPEWDGGPRLVLGTFTKTYATGLKVGWAACDDDLLLGRMLHYKGHQDFGTSAYAQALVQHAVRSGAFDRRLELLRSTYARKCGILDAALRREGLERAGWSWERASGGLYLWLAGPAGLDTGFDGPLFAAAMREGVLYVPGELCVATAGRDNRVRLSFGVLDGAELEDGARRFARAALSV